MLLAEFCVSPAALPCVFILFVVQNVVSFGMIGVFESCYLLDQRAPLNAPMCMTTRAKQVPSPSPHMLSGLFASPMNYRRAPAKASSSISCGPPMRLLQYPAIVAI